MFAFLLGCLHFSLIFHVLPSLEFCPQHHLVVVVVIVVVLVACLFVRSVWVLVVVVVVKGADLCEQLFDNFLR